MCWLWSHVDWPCTIHFHYAMPKLHFKCKFKSSLAKYWSLKTHDSSNHFYLAFVMCCKKSHFKIPCNVRFGPFCPWFLIDALESWPFASTIFDEFWLCTMKVHVKWSLLMKRSLNLDTPCGSYATLIIGLFGKCMVGKLWSIQFQKWPIIKVA